MFASQFLMKEAMSEKAMSWSTENTASEMPAPIPNFPVAGAGWKAAATTRTRMALMKIVAVC